MSAHQAGTFIATYAHYQNTVQRNERGREGHGKTLAEVIRSQDRIISAGENLNRWKKSGIGDRCCQRKEAATDQSRELKDTSGETLRAVRFATKKGAGTVKFPRRRGKQDCYCTATVTLAGLLLLPMVKTTGRLPDVTPGGITAFTWITPETNPGASPAY